jgi:DNA polymerase-3 subunit delta
MLVKYHDLNASINKNILPLYIVIGQDPYLQNDISLKIKQAWIKKGASEHATIDVDDEWQNAFATANHYSLFNELLLLDIRYQKKTINANFKESLLKYLNNYNVKTLIIIKAPNLTYKQLDFLAPKTSVKICSAQQLSNIELEIWIKKELQNLNMQFENDIPKIIAQHSQNNMLAAHQTIIKLNLTYQKNPERAENSSPEALLTSKSKYLKCQHTLTSNILLNFICNQSEYPAYELTTACLQANFTQAIYILQKFANNNQNTTVYILWLLNHEIEILIHLKQSEINGTLSQNTYKILKIWPQKIKIYEKALQRFSIEKLEAILQQCAHLDYKLKSSTDANVWDKLEQLIMLICLGRQADDKLLVNEI